jgi:hypothetical protein
MAMSMISELRFELGDTMIVGWQNRQLLEVAQEQANPQAPHTHKGGDVCPVHLDGVLMEGGVDQPEDIQDFDCDKPHRNPRNDAKISFGVA